MAEVPRRSDGELLALATIEVDFLITVDAPAPHMFGGQEYSDDGRLAWDACTARSFCDDSALQEKLDDGGYPLRMLGARVGRVRRIKLGERVDPNYEEHRLDA